MSTATRPAATRQSRRAPARPAARLAARPAARRRPTLTEVPAPAPAVAGNGMFALVVVAMLLGGMVVLLVLNTSLAQGAFELGALARTQSQLGVQEQKLLQNVALQESPESLQKRADGLGMVPVVAPVFLRLADGAVLGTPVPAKRVRGTTGLPTTGLTGTPVPGVVGATGAAGAVATTGTSTGTPTRTATKAAGDSAVADPPPTSDAAVSDTSASSTSRRQTTGAHQ